MSRGALLLMGVPIAGALLVWLAISIFGSNPATTLPEDSTAQSEPEPAAEPKPANETVPAGETAPAVEQTPGTFPDNEPESVAEAAPVTEMAPTEADPAPAVPTQPEQPAQPQQPGAVLAATNEVVPTAPQSALGTISGTVRVSVRVTIDKQGKVVDATPEEGGPSRYFERISLDASRKWTFPPQASDEQRSALLKFNFTREGVTARANAGD